jgi:hypothetical protein
LYQQWFEVIPGNKSLASTSVKNDIMAGGYYSITLPGTKYTIVNMNSMYCDIDDEVRAVHGNEVEIEASWLQY